MSDYGNLWPVETREVDASVEAAGEYRQMLAALESDDLPRFEARFKALLNENTIREVANFQSQLQRERTEIRERIDIINRSLREIDYNPGRYIVLEAEPTTDAEVRDFQQDLRACTEGSLTGSDDEAYSEAKFLRGEAHHRALPGPRGHRRARQALDAQGHRRAQLVRVLGVGALARGRQRARALLRLGRQIRRPEGEARLHDAGGQPRLSVRPGDGSHCARARSASW